MSKCKAYYCNCDIILQQYNFDKDLIEELEIIDIKKTCFANRNCYQIRLN